MQLSAQDIYEKLVVHNRIIGEKGIISFILNGHDIKILSKDSVGNLLQEWLRDWLISEGVTFGKSPGTQDFPDFQLDLTDPKKGMLEVKSFDYDNSPNFDVAAFLAYRRSLLLHPYRLDSDYLIIGYSMVGHYIEIKDVWLKKVWEITGPSQDWPLKCQVKQGEIFNIRPTKWYLRTGKKDRGPKLPVFNSALQFVQAFDATQRQWTATARDSITSTWLNKVLAGYKAATGNDLV
ncbi:NgoBV family restriction endonuclease [Mucilaginibacter arboris]|uniref:NgoBV family restriction endonuclease n=1 Tax=Mucilaginibacter arboris TaxID=2682090 RepID=A0A7K1T1C2_9SPHI|nr:NgoBV family restriction endonuclease [Mucilaginibacter arboris]MVN23311.1 NgoBV family restriction endonuclease [Mucilaginibacter arboris]